MFEYILKISELRECANVWVHTVLKISELRECANVLVNTKTIRAKKVCECSSTH